MYCIHESVPDYHDAPALPFVPYPTPPPKPAESEGQENAPAENHRTPPMIAATGFLPIAERLPRQGSDPRDDIDGRTSWLKPATGLRTSGMMPVVGLLAGHALR